MRLLSSLLARFALLGALVSGAVAQAAGTGTITYYHNDLLGSPVAATDASGHVIWRESYRPYGERLTNDPASTGNDVWYTSRRQDADTGLVYMGARYYDPVAGRFVSKDPVGFDEKNVHSFNRYAYANDNPYRFVDPNGKITVPAVLGLTFIGVGSAIYLSDSGRRAALEQGIRQGASNFQNNLDAIRDKLGAWIFNDSADNASNTGDKDPSTPTGRRGSPIDVEPGTNEPTSIGGRDYSGHALDRMQGRGVPPSAVEDAIQNGTNSPGNTPGTTVHTGPDGLTVVTGNGGRVVTVIPK